MSSHLSVVPGGNVSPIEGLRRQAWPASKKDYLAEQRQIADAGLRIVVCGFCGMESPMLDGPTGRAWFRSHECQGAA